MTQSLSQSLGGGSPTQWGVDWLNRAVFPITPSNVQVVVSWEYAESGAGGGMWNPLNTTQGGYPGETNANTVGVKNYVRRDDGLDANARVIHNGYYPHVVAAFVAGNDPIRTIDAITASPWGTRHIPLVHVDWPAPVPSPNHAPPPTPVPPQEDMHMVIVGPRQANGRFPTARAVKGYDAVLLEDGGAVQGDKPNGTTRVWQPTGLPPNSHIIDIAAPAPSTPSSVAFVARYAYANGSSGTYEASHP